MFGETLIASRYRLVNLDSHASCRDVLRCLFVQCVMPRNRFTGMEGGGKHYSEGGCEKIRKLEGT